MPKATGVYFGPGTLPVKVRDLETGEIRMGRLKDCRDFARLLDFLEFVHFFKSMIMPHGRQPQVR